MLLNDLLGTQSLISMPTPIIQLQHVVDEANGAKVWVKAEFLNLSGSVKDRPARAIIREGIKTGRLTKEKTLIDYTTGNMGIAYAMIGASLGYKVALCLPRNVSNERKRILKAFNAELIETDPVRGQEGAISVAKSVVERNPDHYFYPDQYKNDENWRAHYDSTGEEIWQQTKGGVTHFICGTGTAGTFVGVAKRLKDYNPSVETSVMRPSSPLHGLEGIRYMPQTPASFYDEALVDRRFVVSTEEARNMTLRLARQEGLFVGLSSGANVAAALKLAADLPPSALVVTILFDTGFRYLNDKLWDTPPQNLV